MGSLKAQNCACKRCRCDELVYLVLTTGQGLLTWFPDPEEAEKEAGLYLRGHPAEQAWVCAWPRWLVLEDPEEPWASLRNLAAAG